MKSRDEMLNYLHSIPVGARATVATMDMGLQYEYVTKDGYGESFGNMGDWPAHAVHGITIEKLFEVKDKIKSKVLKRSDLEGTGLEKFYNYVFAIERSEEYIPLMSDFFEGLLEINKCDDVVYILCDGREWKPKALFFENYGDLSKAFTRKYISYVEKWEICDDEELSYWIKKIDEELSRIAINVFGVCENE